MLSDIVRVVSRVKHVWSGRVAPGGILSNVVLVESRVKLVGSGLGCGR